MTYSFLVSELADPVIELASNHSGNPVSQRLEEAARDWTGQIGGEPSGGTGLETALQPQPGLVLWSGRSVQSVWPRREWGLTARLQTSASTSISSRKISSRSRTAQGTAARVSMNPPAHCAGLVE